MKNKFFWFSFIVLIMGIVFGFLENTFYQYIDENNVLIESWFMPLSFICIFFGSLGLFFVAIKRVWLKIKKSV